MGTFNYHLSDEEIDRFDQIYDATCSREEQLEFLASLSENPELKQKYQFYRALRKEIIQHSENHLGLKTYLDSLHSYKPKKSWPFFRFSLGIAASIAIVVAAYFFFLPSKAEKLYTEYRDSEALPPILMNEKTSSDYILLIAREDYSGALAALKQCELNDTLAFYQAYCYEMTDSDQEALARYQELAPKNESTFAQKAQFRVALLYLKRDEPQLALPILETIAQDTSHLYHALSQEIFDRLW